MPQAAVNTDAHGTTFTLKYKVITPMLGGGARPGQADDDGFRLRAPALRGHLRFWWRATAGARLYQTVDDLRVAEAELWGSAGGPGRVRIHQRVLQAGRHLTEGEKQEMPNPNWDIFPIYLNRRSSVIVEQEAVLRIRLRTSGNEQERNRQANEILRTICAFLMFGGVGGRWHRGLGGVALSGEAMVETISGAEPVSLSKLTGISLGPNDAFQNEFWQSLTLHGTRNPVAWPHLHNVEGWRPLAAPMGRNATAVTALVEMIDNLREYRTTGACSEFVGQQWGSHWAENQGLTRQPSGVILRVVRIGQEWATMAVPLRMATVLRDSANRTYDSGVQHFLDYLRGAWGVA